MQDNLLERPHSYYYRLFDIYPIVLIIGNSIIVIYSDIMIKNNVLKFIFIVSMIVAIGFPLISIKYVYPTFTALLLKNTERDALRAGAHMSHMYTKYKEDIERKVFPDDFFVDADNLMRDFALMKLKIFSFSGETLYSTNYQEIGELNNKPYFHEVVAKGKPYSRIVKITRKSLVGETVTIDAVEAYVPVMKHEKFIGAFELYYDITERIKELNRKVFISSILPVAMMFIFLLVIVAILIKADKLRNYSDSRRMSLRYKSPYYSMAMMAVSIFLAEIIDMYIISHMNGLSIKELALIDSGILVMIMTPSIYFFFVQPLMKYISELRATQEELRHEIAARKEAEGKLYDLSITDELTGLNNRRGFFTLAEHRLALAKRDKAGLLILYADVDNLKQINDKYGHEEGDKLIISAAEILKSTYRQSDIIARIGGDEFVVFPVGTTEEHLEIISDRLKENIDNYNNREDSSMKLSMSIGIAAYNPESVLSLSGLLAQADNLMFEQKKQKKKMLEGNLL